MRTVFAAIAAAAISLPALAETPQLRCVAAREISVTTLPWASNLTWPQTPIRGGDLTQASAVWFKVLPRTEVAAFVSVMIGGEEWDWISVEVAAGVYAAGWTPRSGLWCDQ